MGQYDFTTGASNAFLVTSEVAQAFKAEYDITTDDLATYVHGVKVELTRAADIQPSTGCWFGGQFVLNAGSSGYTDLDKPAYVLQAIFKGNDVAPDGVDINVARFEVQSAGTVGEMVYLVANTGCAVSSMLELATHIVPSTAMMRFNVQSSQTVLAAIDFITGSGSSINYGLDLSGATINTADIRFQGGATLADDGTNLTLAGSKLKVVAPDISGTVTAATTLTMPAFTLGGTMDANSQALINVLHLDLGTESAAGTFDATLTAANAGAAWVIKSRDSSDIHRARLGLSGGVDTAVWAWVNSTHTGIVLSGALDAGSQNITSVGALGVTTIGAFQATGAIDFNSQNMTNVDIDSGTIDGFTWASIAKGDILYANATPVSTRLAIGTDNYLLSVATDVPAWLSPANVLGDLSGQAGATFDWNNQSLTNLDDLTASGSFISSGGNQTGKFLTGSAGNTVFSFSGGNFDIRAGSGGASSQNVMRVTSAGDFGIGSFSTSLQPDTKLEILNAGDQLKLSFDGTDNTVFAVDTNGVLTITPSGAAVDFASKNLTGLGTLSAFTAGGDILGQATYDLGSEASSFAEAFLGGVYNVKIVDAMAGIYFGDITDSWDVLLKRGAVNYLYVRKPDDSGYASIWVDNALFQGNLLSQTSAAGLSAYGATGAYFLFNAQDTGVGHVEVGRLIGGANPSMRIGGVVGGIKAFYSGTVQLLGTLDLHGETFEGHITLAEVTAPGVGAENTARLYAHLVDGGKTELCVIFQSGAVQVLATEP